jgi:hypothetical protein
MAYSPFESLNSDRITDTKEAADYLIADVLNRPVTYPEFDSKGNPIPSYLGRVSDKIVNGQDRAVKVKGLK